jgi:hypothetical protein
LVNKNIPRNEKGERNIRQKLYSHQNELKNLKKKVNTIWKGIKEIKK